MLGLHSFDIDKNRILGLLEDFESFCLGKRHMTPDEIKNLNEELSIGAIIHVGKYRLEKEGLETRLLWISPDNCEHDLGPIHKVNVMRDCPGFHRTRSLALGHEHVETSSQISAPNGHTQVSVVKMKDGSTGYGPNYRVALRNAALKMHLKNSLKNSFERVNPGFLWKMFYGNA